MSNESGIDTILQEYFDIGRCYYILRIKSAIYETFIDIIDFYGHYNFSLKRLMLNV